MNALVLACLLAATWTVDDDAPADFTTLQAAVEAARPGDVVQVRPGTYAGCKVSPPRCVSGTAEAPITVRGTRGPGGEWLTRLVGRGAWSWHTSTVEVEASRVDRPERHAIRYWQFEDLEVTGGKHGFDVREASNVSIRRVWSHHNAPGDGVFGAFTYWLTLEDSLLHDNGEHGVYVSNASDGAVLRGNRVHHNRDSGIQINAGTKGMPGTRPDDISSDCVLERNVIWAQRKGYNLDGVERAIVQNSVVWGNEQNGLVAYDGDGAIAPRNCIIRYNTVVQPAGTTGDALHLVSGGTGNQVHSNVLVGYAAIRVRSRTAPGIVSDRNVLIGRLRTAGADSTSNTAPATWQAGGFDPNSRFGAWPADVGRQFARVGAGDLRLTTGALGAELALPTAQAGPDLEGNPRDDSPDAGALERQQPIAPVVRLSARGWLSGTTHVLGGTYRVYLGAYDDGYAIAGAPGVVNLHLPDGRVSTWSGTTGADGTAHLGSPAYRLGVHPAGVYSFRVRVTLPSGQTALGGSDVLITRPDGSFDTFPPLVLPPVDEVTAPEFDPAPPAVVPIDPVLAPPPPLPPEDLPEPPPPPAAGGLPGLNLLLLTAAEVPVAVARVLWRQVAADGTQLGAGEVAIGADGRLVLPVVAPAPEPPAPEPEPEPEPEPVPQAVTVTTDRPTYRVGEVRTATIVVRNAAGQPLAGVRVTRQAVRPDGSIAGTSVGSTNALGQTTSSGAASLPAGLWRFRATAVVDGQTVTAEASYEVTP